MESKDHYVGKFFSSDEEATRESEELTVDFSKQTLKRIERANSQQQLATTLILDNNEIQRLDNLETYSRLQKLSVVNNQLIRMYGVSQLVLLQELDLSSNSLVTIEGLKDLIELKQLKLAKNRIKTIEHLNSNLKLEKIDLSENNVMHISDISFLENLKELNLHGNRISFLRLCEKNLPANLEILTLNNNALTDLNEISHLVHLTSLKELSIVNNPCLDFSEDQKFNYRPFVKNWCSSLVVLDNCPLDDIECLKAEWLYSQGRGRSFRAGEHAALIEYLVSVCPKEAGEDSETEDVKKLKLILSKAQLHQQQLRAQLSTGKFDLGETGKNLHIKKKPGAVPERMVTSFHDSSSKDLKTSSDLMSRSLDSGMLRATSRTIKSDVNHTPLQTSTTFIPIPDTLISPDVGQHTCLGHRGPSSLSSRASLSSSRNSPHSTPESKRKTLTPAFRKEKDCSGNVVNSRKHGKLFNSKSSFPLSRSYSAKGVDSVSGKGNNGRESDRNCRETSEEEDSEALATKIRAIQLRVNQRRHNKLHQVDAQKAQLRERECLKAREKRQLEKDEKDLMDGEASRAAVCIQRWWRGYRTRNLDGNVVSGCKSIQLNRMQDYILKVVNDMEATRTALEGNRKLVVLQMQAINALWKKMTALQPAVGSCVGDDKVSLGNLMETCSNLNKQVEALQAMMKTMQSSPSLVPIATQTEIVAIHTPQNEHKELFSNNPTLKLDQSEPSIGSGEYQLIQENTNSSDNTSSTSALKTVTEYHSHYNIRDASVEEISLVSESMEEDAEVPNEELTKPASTISEDNNEAILFLAEESNRQIESACSS